MTTTFRIRLGSVGRASRPANAACGTSTASQRSARCSTASRSTGSWMARVTRSSRIWTVRRRSTARRASVSTGSVWGCASGTESAWVITAICLHASGVILRAVRDKQPVEYNCYIFWIKPFWLNKINDIFVIFLWCSWLWRLQNYRGLGKGWNVFEKAHLSWLRERRSWCGGETHGDQYWGFTETPKLRGFRIFLWV